MKTTLRRHKTPVATLRNRQTPLKNLSIFFFSWLAKSILPDNENTPTKCNQTDASWAKVTRLAENAPHTACTIGSLWRRKLHRRLHGSTHDTWHTNYKNGTEKKKLTARYMLKRCMISQKSSTAEPPPTSSPCRGFNLRYLQLNATCAFAAVENCDTFLSEKSLWKTHWTCSLLATFCKNLVVKTFQRANFIPSRVTLLQTITLYCFSCHYRVQCSRVGPVDPSSY